MPYEPKSRSHSRSHNQDPFASLLRIPKCLEPSDDLDYYIGTNEEPHPAFRDQVLSVYTEHDKARLKAIEENIFRIPDILKSLERMRRDVLLTLKDYSAVTSAVRRLPVEILERIFAFAAAACQDDRQYLDNLGANTPWMISGVCRRWRDIVNLMQDVKRVVNTDLAHITIERRETQLLVTIRAHGHPALAYPATRLVNILPLICADCETWDELKIIASQTLLSSLYPLKGRLVSVNSMHLEVVRRDSWRPPRLATFDAFAEMPSLRTLSGFPHLIGSCVLPHHQVRHFIAHMDPARSSYYDLWEILRRMSCLERCTVSRNGDDFPDLFPDYRGLSTLTLPIVTSFSVSMFAENILSRLRLPSLQKCQLDDCETHEADEEDTSHVQDRLLDFFAQSTAGLKHLHLAGIHPCVNYVKLLEALPGLLTLRVVCCIEDIKHFEACIIGLLQHYIKAPSSAFLPELREVHIDLRVKSLWHSNYNPELEQRVLQARPTVQCRFEIDEY